PLEEWLEVTLEPPEEPPPTEHAVTNAPDASNLAEGWATTQIGVGAPGSMQIQSGSWTVSGGGTGLRSNADNVLVVHRELELSGQVLAQLETFDGAQPESAA